MVSASLFTYGKVDSRDHYCDQFEEESFEIKEMQKNPHLTENWIANQFFRIYLNLTQVTTLTLFKSTICTIIQI